MSLNAVRNAQEAAEGPPSHLSDAGRRFWLDVTADFDLEPHQEKLLLVACDALDRANQARLVVDAQGLMVDDRYGSPKPHPLIAVERDARVVFMRALRELALEEEPPPEARPTRGRGRR
jgi:phage terminase small subunit